MNYSRDWTLQEIETLKIGFLKGISLKVMAHELGRTPSALNKALSRFAIRKKRKKQDLELERTNFNEIKVKIKKEKKPSFKDDIIWVDLNKVINYLENKGMQIQPINMDNKIFYNMNNKPSLPSQIVLNANKLRLEEKKPIFLVQDVTF